MAIAFDTALGKHVRVDGGPGSGRRGHVSGTHSTTTHPGKAKKFTSKAEAESHSTKHKLGASVVTHPRGGFALMTHKTPRPRDPLAGNTGGFRTHYIAE